MRRLNSLVPADPGRQESRCVAGRFATTRSAPSTASTALHPPERPTTWDGGCRWKPPLFASTHCSMRRKRRSRKSSRSHSVTPEHVAFGSYVLLSLADAGAESPQETRLRLLLVRSGLPRPVTQIPVTNDWGHVARRIDMGWPEWMVGAEYDGEHHWTDPARHAEDIERLEFLAARGWMIVRVSARQLRYQSALVVERVRTALQRAGFPR